MSLILSTLADQAQAMSHVLAAPAAPAAPQGAGKGDYATLILVIIAISTFMLKGKQWPTFITAIAAGFMLGGGGSLSNIGNALAGVGNDLVSVMFG